MNEAWLNCIHEWEGIESQWNNERYSCVRCKHCGCDGELDEQTGEVFWPAT